MHGDLSGLERCGREELPAEAWVAAVASLPDLGPARVRAFSATSDPGASWAEVCAGRGHLGVLGQIAGPDPAGRAANWARCARRIDPATRWREHIDAGVGMSLAGTASYPDPFVGDPNPPPILFHLGDPEVVAGPRVAVVGTRDCSRYGFDIAYELGRDLAAAGVRVVSGLALGIDGAAHAGALAGAGAPPVAVVGSGPDVVYPARNGPLWRAVAREGVIFTEYPLGAGPVAWHFPARNRLIAALADVIVVVESHERGGALLTVDEAILRGRDVMAVPGPVRAEASDGTNKLLAEGRGVVRDANDVLDSLGLMSETTSRGRDARSRPVGSEAKVLDAFEWRPVTAGELVTSTGLPLGEVGLALDGLEDAGWVSRRGGWYERVALHGG